MKNLSASVLLATGIAIGVMAAAFAPGSGEPGRRFQRSPARLDVAANQQSRAAPPSALKTNIPYSDAKPILQVLREDLWPAELKAKAPAELAAGWPEWVSHRDRTIRTRVEGGDEDSIIHFYSEQTIQPFAVIDSLIRLELAKSAELQVTSFDVSPRVIQHLEAARARARAGSSYTLVLPRSLDRPWTPNLVKYWERFGDRIGDDIKAPPPPPSAGRVEVRSVLVRPSVVLSTTPLDLNIVLQRLEAVSADDQFDLVLATNLLLYYDVFEQSLAVANIAKMLRPGGFFLSNNRILELPAAPVGSVGYTDVTYMKLPGIGETGDRIIWYQRP